MRWGGIAALAVGGVLLAVALGATSAVDRYVEGFSAAPGATYSDDARGRLLDPSNNGRIDYWRVAVTGFASAPAGGTGAGTYALLWDRDRPTPGIAADAHSLYLEVVAELGIVGLALLALPLGLVAVRLVTRLGGESNATYAVLFAAFTAWALRAAIDWDWEMPAATLWVFAIGGTVLARRSGGRRGQVRSATRLVAGLLVVAAAILPARIAVSEAELERARAAYRGGDCTTAPGYARAALSAVPARAEPYEIIAFCNFEQGRFRPAARSMEAATSRDPGNWRYLWGLAITKGAAGEGAGAARAERSARLRNPLEPATSLVGRRTTEEWREEGGGLLPSPEP